MKKLFFDYIKLIMGLIAVIALPSCLQNETTITLNKDGSGTIVEETYLTAAMLEMSSQFAQPGVPSPAEELLSEEKAKTKAAAMGEGVEFVKTEKIEKNGMRGARIHYKFADINKISVNPSSAIADVGGENAEAGDDDLVKFKYADGELSIITPPTDFEDFSMDLDDEDSENAQMAEMMKQLMADMKMTFNLKFTDGIKKTNASYVDGDTITFFDVEIGKMIAQTAKLKEISELAKTDKDAAVVEFKKLEGIKVETEENVKVTLK